VALTTARASRQRPPAAAPRHRLSASRQRQRLIDACISALHIYGPSRTTVAKVVAIAKLSPGIVRFYFKSKAAMLVASLRFLSTEFDQLVLDPVAELRHSPEQALQKMVELYLDPAVASTRKISVWYAFWGEASARQEYQDICGQKDDRFANLVLELIGRMIEQGGLTHLDTGAVSLGLIGVLEMLWQGFAFQEDEDIDRAAARGRAMAYLASVFPGHFGVPATPGARAQDTVKARENQPAEGSYAAELAQCFTPAWQLAGHAAELRASGDYLAIELATSRALIVHDGAQLRAFGNSCPYQPHTLVRARHGQLPGVIACPLHRLSFGFDGCSVNAADNASLVAMPLAVVAGLLYVNARPTARAPRDFPAGSDALSSASPVEEPAFAEIDVAADWKISVEQLLLHRLPERAGEGGAQSFGLPTLEVLADRRQLLWQATPVDGADPPWRRAYLWPNILLEWRPDGMSAIQVVPTAAGRSRWQCFDYGHTSDNESEQALAIHARRIGREALRFDIELAASTQRGLAAPGYSATRQAQAPQAVAFFRQLATAVAAGS
jgi:TetR/AcrR family transcriptional repressor of bet genes